MIVYWHMFICKILVHQSDDFCHILFLFNHHKLVDPNETLYNRAFQLGLHCLQYFKFNLDVMRQSACLVLNTIMVYSYGFFFNCTTVGQASDSMTALT